VTKRERLPDRREAELLDFEHGGRRWTATVARFPDGNVAEIFLDGSKVAPLAEMAKESAIVASLALQHGAPLDNLRHALNGRETGPLGAALGLSQAMSALVLISGSIFKGPETRQTKAGAPFTVLTLKVAAGNETEWWRVAVFAEAAQDELTGLALGDGVAVVGSIQPRDEALLDLER
jgi:ribonucleoside-diphosphate reductase alpha chain